MKRLRKAQNYYYKAMKRQKRLEMIDKIADIAFISLLVISVLLLTAYLIFRVS